MLSTLHYFEERDTSTTNIVIPSSDDNDEDINIVPPLHVGLVFWREDPDPDMNDWFDWEHVTNALPLQRHKENDQDERL